MTCPGGPGRGSVRGARLGLRLPGVAGRVQEQVASGGRDSGARGVTGLSLELAELRPAPAFAGRAARPPAERP